MKKTLDSILNNDTKVKILRLFISRTEGYHASGREVARLIEVTAPTAHTVLKELYGYHILNYEISGRNHLYSLNRQNRIVKDMLLPIFIKEDAVKKDIYTFIKDAIKRKKISKNIVSVLLYGSQQIEKADEASDVDIAVVVHNKKDLKIIEDLFIEDITSSFHNYFGTTLDVYIKTKADFIKRRKNNLSPVSTLMKSYSVIYGKDPSNWR